MKRILLVIIFLFSTLVPLRAELSDSELKEIAFNQNPGQQVPVETEFQDSTGNRVKLAKFFNGQKAVILVPGYFRCRMLCEGVSDGLIQALQATREVAGRDFRVVYISIDPAETNQAAAERKATWLRRYGRTGSEVEFLHGDAAAISQITDAIGFHFRFDPGSREFAHPAGFVVLRPDGTIFRYFFGVSYSGEEVENALATAAAPSRPPASKIEELVLLCFHYNPLHSRYGQLVMNSVRVLSIATMAGLVLLVIRRPKEKRGSA
jgi:protein SCO1/2